MENTGNRAIAIVGVGAVLPDAPNAPAFWKNIKEGRYSITEVTPDRWDPALYYDPDPAAPDKTYSKIGGWVREHVWDPMKWRLPIPPRVANAMDKAQQWAISSTREALEDYGYPKRPIDTERTAVILGNAMAGEKHYLTSMRVYFPEYARELAGSAAFSKLPDSVRRDITEELHNRISKFLPEVTEDSMPGELANCIAGRIANLYNFHGPNFVCDAACASAMAAMTAAAEGLVQHHFDYAVAGGIDRNMGAPTFVKFCKIGALSATGSRPYADGADGFVMGEGTVIFLLRRLADAERDGDKIYAVIRGIAGSSDGKGKGITAPNPVGQKIAVERAWDNAGLSPATATYIEGHGTSTKVGDVVEVESIAGVLSKFNVPPHAVALGSVKSNIGHLKGAAGAAGLLKTAMALHEKVLPPSLKFERPNPNIDFAHCPLYVNTELREWKVPADTPRRAGASAFGFGGTNFHVVLEEFMPGRINGNGKRSTTVNVPAALAHEAPMNGNTATPAPRASDERTNTTIRTALKAPLRGALVVGATTETELTERLGKIQKEAAAGHSPQPTPPVERDLHAPERIVIDYGNASELAERSAKALKALAADQPAIWKALRAQGVFRGRGPAAKVAFLYTGQGSQYVNMLRELRKTEPIVADTFAEADRVMTPILGKPLTDYIYVDKADPAAVAQAEDDLRQTAITQPAVLATDASMTRLLAAYGIEPDMTMGHSLGEYGALVASGGLPFEDALEAVAARGREMTRVSMADNGKMAAVLAPLKETERIISEIDGYVVVANINSDKQSVIGGASKAVEHAIESIQKAGYTAIPLPVSHAFHTSIVSPASEPLRKMLQRLRLHAPRIPVVANVDGEFYPTGDDETVVSKMLDILAKQVAAPVQFIKGLQTLYAAGVRVFVETGPKKALHGFVEDVLGDKGDVVSFFTNHPKLEDVVAFNQALCGLFAAGLGRGTATEVPVIATISAETERPVAAPVSVEAAVPVETQREELVAQAPVHVQAIPTTPVNGNRYVELGRMFAEVLERGYRLYKGETTPDMAPVVITGAALGLPGTDRVFDDSNVERILRGDQFIRPISTKLRQGMLDKNITRLVKSDNGGPVFEAINSLDEVIKLAGRGGKVDLESEYGLSAERVSALDRTTVLAIAAGMDALRDAGIPLVMRYKTTTKGTQLPDRWSLPEALRDDTGVIFASAFPGYNAFADEMERYHNDRSRHDQLARLERVRKQAKTPELVQDIDQQILELRATIEKDRYVLDRLFLFRTLPMGHSQFAEHIGARGPNTQINSACASTAQAIALAEDWIRAGRCRRVIIISSDDVTSDNLMPWIGAGFLASGAAATDEVVEDAAIPFDRRRHGMIVGMGAAAIVVEAAGAARERGIRPICEVLGSITANSAFHGSRLDVHHISEVMEGTIAQAEQRGGIHRDEIAPRMVFVSHETYTPARGGSASAEIFALRRVFRDHANDIIITNTKGLTGHAMATGMEDVVAIKALETGLVPPVVNFKEVDPELGQLNLCPGGKYPVQYALHLGAGFGSQISMNMLRWVQSKDGSRPSPQELGYAYRIQDATTWNDWLAQIAGHPAAELEVVNRTLRVRDRAVTRATMTTQQPRPEPAQAPVIETAAPQRAEVQVMAAAAGVGFASAAATPAIESVVEKPSPVVVSVAPAGEVKPVPQPVAPPAEARTPATPSQEISVKDHVLALVAEKTGYPIDMLDLDLDLEADLGVDTVKQAEVFASIREAYGIARDDTIKLRDFPTLAHVIRFVYDRRPDLTQHNDAATLAQATEQPAMTVVVPRVAIAEESPVAATVPAPVRDGVKERILNLVVEKTGYPKDMLDLDLDLEADLGVDTVKQAEMFAAIRELYNIPRDETIKLRDFPTLSRVIKFVYDRRPDLTAADVATQPVVAPKPTVEPAAITAQPVASQPRSLVADSFSDEAIKETVLDIVAAKTGYPEDMLDLDLDLEADLGVDTVKQAEVFASVRAAFNIPRDENLKLRDFPTLNHVIKFARDKRAACTAQNASTEVPQVAPETVAPIAAIQDSPDATALATADVITDEQVKEKVLDVVAEKTGYPKDMLDLDLDLEADLGVDTVKQAEVFASVRAAFSIPRDENLKLRDFPTLNHVIQFACERRSGKPPQVAVPAVDGIAHGEPVPATVPVADTPPAAEAPVVQGTAVTDEDVKEKVLDLVAGKTGYPKDMLDLDLDLEADLGVDTVKQAEVFASVRATFNIPRDENLKLRDFPTLGHVIRFACERRAGVQQTTAPVLASKAGTREADEPTESDSSRPTLVPQPRIVQSFEAADAIPRRVPVPVPRPPLDACKETGVKLGPGTRVVVMPDEGGVSAALAERLRQKGVVLLTVDRTIEPTRVPDLVKEWRAGGAITGVYWLPALDDEGPIASMDFARWRDGLRIRLKLLYALMRALYDEIAKAGTFLVSATRFGGQHGYDILGATAPMGGAVAGFTKTFKRERPEALVKVVDVECSAKPSEVAQALLDETTRDTGAVEIGYKDGLRWTVGLQEKPAVDGQPGMLLDSESVFVITGAAGSIVSAITADLASASGGTFYLLDLVPEPDPSNADIQRFVTDKDGLKRDLFRRIQERGERATPALVEKELAALERAHAALSAINAVRNAGGRPRYFSVNLTDFEAVAKIVKEIRERSGRIDVLLHAAGLERSHFLPDKDPREFDLVFDVKSDGWFNLLHSVGNMPLGATVAFSSIAGRFGNAGQTDYSSANDLLCKLTSNFRLTRPDTRGIAIDWTAWGGIGMATRGSIPKMMEMAGIDMLPPEAGVPLIRRELVTGSTRGEIVIGKRLGVLLNEWDSEGGINIDALEHARCGPMIGNVVCMGIHRGLIIETTLDPKEQPFLHDHQIDGTPVLPGVMGMEAFAEVAACMLPGWHVVGLEQVELLAPFKFYRNEARTLTIESSFEPVGLDLVAHCRLLGKRKLPNHPDPQTITHFTARVRLSRSGLRDMSFSSMRIGTPGGPVSESSEIYRVYFHGPAYQVLRCGWRDGGRVVGEMAANLPHNHVPPERPTLIAPRVLELCLQTAGLWEIAVEDRFGLPHHIDEVRLLRASELATSTLYCVATPDTRTGAFDVEVFDAAGLVYVTMRGYRTAALPTVVDGSQLKALQAVAAD